MNTGKKYDQQKPRFSLIPPISIIHIVNVLEYGAKKYGDDNYKHVEDSHTRYLDAMMRHYLWGEALDEQVDSESNLPHIAHMASCLIFILSKIPLRVANDPPVKAIQTDSSIEDIEIRLKDDNLEPEERNKLEQELEDNTSYNSLMFQNSNLKATIDLLQSRIKALELKLLEPL